MNLKNQPLLLLLCCFIAASAYSQNIQVCGEVNLLGITSSEDGLPFWMYSNQRGRIDRKSNYAGWISGKAFYNLGNAGGLEAGGGILYNDGFNDHIFLDELYARYNYKWLQITGGRKQRPELYNGLSASNESILWSLNARPIPGLQIGTVRPIFPFSNKSFGFEASWNDYKMEEDRFMSRANLHHKNFRLVYRTTRAEVKAGLQHFVQWGGSSQIGGKQPDGIADYLRVIAGQSGGENANGGDQLNALGNHLGGYELYFTRFFKLFKAELFYNHLFDDKSGMRLGNTPDGRYGLFVESFREKQWVNSFLYEFYYTKHQSSTTTGAHKWDNYFNNFLYRSGWTYHEKVIGAPFFIPNLYDEEHAAGYVRIGNNKFIAHHFGASGIAFKNFPYRILTSYRKNYGHYRIAGDYLSEYYAPDDPRGEKIIPEEVVSSLLEANIPSSFVNLTISFGADFTTGGVNLGAGLNLHKRF